MSLLISRYKSKDLNSDCPNQSSEGIKMQLSGIEKGLKEGCRLHGWRSGGGLRVITIEQAQTVRGYGEHPNVEDALSHANEDFLAGRRPYKDVYGKLKPLYLTGSMHATSPLDHWLLRGRTIDAYVQEGNVVVELRGYADTETPKQVIAKVNRTRRPVKWTQRGYTYETSQSRLPNGESCQNTRILKAPKGRDGADPWMYRIVKTGRGKEVFKALQNAFKAEEVEEATKV